MLNSTRNFKAAKGFTLVEVLVVIGIIAVLIGLLLPTLSRARAQARELQCATILRSWGQAFFAYAAMNKGKLPHSADRASNLANFREMDQPDRPANSCAYDDLLPPLMNRKAWFSYPIGQRPTDDIWQCPLAESLGDTAYGGYKPSVSGYHSFVMNMYLDDDATGWPPNMGYHAYPSFLNLAAARQPSVTLLLFETTLVPAQCCNQEGYSGTSCDTGKFSHDNAYTVGDRHPHQRGKLGANLLMLDGHIAWTDQLYNNTDGNLPPVTNRTWFPY